MRSFLREKVGGPISGLMRPRPLFFQFCLFLGRGILKVNNSIRVAGQLNWQIPNEQFACSLEGEGEAERELLLFGICTFRRSIFRHF